MRKSMLKILSVALVLVMMAGTCATAFAAEVTSGTFRLPTVKERPVEAPETEMPETTDEPIDGEVVETPAEEVEEPFSSYGAYVVLGDETSSLNVRSAAVDGAVIGSLHHGDHVTVKGEENGWKLVSGAGVEGYVSGDYLKSSMPATEPEVEEPVVEPEAPVEEPTVEEPAVEEPAKEEAAEEAVEIPTTLGDADVRLEADGLSEIFTTLPEGTELVVLGVEGDWIKVEIDGQIGYIYKDGVQGLPAEEDEEAEVEMKVTIFSSRRTVMTPGETVYLTSKLEGLDGYELTFQWQYDRGNGFENVPGATGDSYSFAAEPELLSYDWRLVVNYEE